MIEGQTSIFEMLYPTYKFTKPIRLIEFFAGYGSQALALKYLGVKFEHWKICEWAIKSIQAYKDIHFPNDYHPAGVMDIPKEEIIDYLYKKGISNNYNEPMTLEQIKRLKDVDLYNIYENIYVTNNLVNIQQVKGVDLEIKDTDQYDYILTYSFPCQDLSLAGTRKLMSDTSTRSGMLWEVERILTECKDLPENTNLKGITKENMKIRKLIPREAFRLMGVKDEDFDKIAKNQSDSSLYHLAGDSIVVNVLMAIFGEMI